MNIKLRNDLILLGGIIIISAFGARYLAHGETLEEYAQNNSSSNLSTNIEDEKSTISAATLKSTNVVTSLDNEYSTLTKNTDNASLNASFYSRSDEEQTNMDNLEKIVYMDGFYYENIPDEIVSKISDVSYKENDNISLSDLRYVVLKYIDFNGDVQIGEMICNQLIAQDIVEIFYELYKNNYQIEKIHLVDEYGADDELSMENNNTSCFNYRVVQGTSRLSKHSLGLAIDINPYYNPYITYNSDCTCNIFPKGSEKYADRTSSFPYKIDESDLAYKLFKEHGFTWGGNWNSVKDYQHFEFSY